MSSRFHVVPIEDFVVHEIDPDAQHHLLDLFDSAVRSTLPTLAREARFETSDFASAEQRDVAGFSLHLTRLGRGEQTMWQGTFTRIVQRGHCADCRERETGAAASCQNRSPRDADPGFLS
jgi:hypothetical protein